MNCAKVAELASEYLEGTLPSALDSAVRAHLAACPPCAADLEALQSVWARLSALPTVEPPPFFHENVMTAVERQAHRPAAWRDLLPRLSRVALGTLATGSAAALIAWKVFLPSLDSADVRQAGPVVPPISGPIAAPVVANPPRLRMERTTVVDPEHGPGYEWMIGLEGAARGVARFEVLTDDSLEKKLDPIRFTLSDSRDAPQMLRVPFAAVRGDTLNLRVRWTPAGGAARTTYLFVPIPQDDALPPERQSFGLPEAPLVHAARQVAARYGQPVLLEDVPDVGKVTVIAREETALEALRRALAGRGVHVSATAAGILLTPDTAAPPPR